MRRYDDDGMASLRVVLFGFRTAQTASSTTVGLMLSVCACGFVFWFQAGRGSSSGFLSSSSSWAAATISVIRVSSRQIEYRTVCDSGVLVRFCASWFGCWLYGFRTVRDRQQRVGLWIIFIFFFCGERRGESAVTVNAATVLSACACGFVFWVQAGRGSSSGSAAIDQKTRRS
jgi:hypothetical protein